MSPIKSPAPAPKKTEPVGNVISLEAARKAKAPTTTPNPDVIVPMTLGTLRACLGEDLWGGGDDSDLPISVINNTLKGMD